VFLGDPPVTKTQAGEKDSLERVGILGRLRPVNGGSPRFVLSTLLLLPVPRY